MKKAAAKKAATKAAKPATKPAATTPTTTWGAAVAAWIITELDRVQGVLKGGMTAAEVSSTLALALAATPGSTMLARLGPLPRPDGWSGSDAALQPVLGVALVKKGRALVYGGRVYVEWNHEPVVSAADCLDFVVAARALLEPRLGQAVLKKGALAELSFPAATEFRALVHGGIRHETVQLLIEFAPL